jgi:hypothetical protein
MKRSKGLFLLVCCALLAAGCTTGYSKKEVLDAGSQVEIRSYQTRSYDTTDKIRVLRSVMATLQDLGFVIDKADDVVGVVSATKLNGYAMSMTVSVRANGEQMIVRANAQYGLKAIEQPGPYQDFFNALDKGLFLDRNMLADDLPTQNLAAPNNAAAASPPRPAAAAAVGAGSVFDYYGEAEEEINAQSYDKDLWARALVAAEGDEQKRKARYIELRAEQLFLASGAAATAPSQAAQRSSSIQPAPDNIPQAGASVANPAAARFSDDLSGSWIAEISSNQQEVFTNMGPSIEFTLEQSGNRITGRNREYNLKISGTRNGDEIEFWVDPHRMNYFQGQTGTWKVGPDRASLTGDWKLPNLRARGQWNMTRDSAQTAAAEAAKRRAAAGRLTGTYYSKMTGSYKRSNAGSFYIEQNGDQITGYSEGKGWEIEGKVSGSTVTYKWYGHSNKGKGKFSIDEYGNLSGDYHGDSWGQGEWRLTRIN